MRSTRAAACLGGLTLLTLPWWAAVADDVYITLAYAGEALNGHGLQHTNGERTEGFSNWVWLIFATFATSTDLDAILVLQGLSLLSGFAFTAWVALSLPAGWRGSVAALTVASMTPLAAWSGDAMETVFHGLVLSVGWVLAFHARRWPILGFVLLAIAAVSRPEAHVHLFAAVALLAARQTTRLPRKGLLLLTVGLCGFHAARWYWFGSLIPNPILAKSSMGPTWPGAAQVGLDLLIVAPPMVTMLALFRGMKWRAALVPVGLQAGIIALGPIDWMGAGRLLLPGAMASISLLIYTAASAAPRRTSPATGVAALACLGLLLQTGVTPGSDSAHLAPRPLPSLDSQSPFSRGIETPFIRDVVFLAGEIPPEQFVYTGDAGLAGLVPDLRIWDTAGLVDRAIAEFRSSGSSLSSDLASRIDGSVDSAVCYKQRIQGPPSAIDSAIPHYRIRLATMQGDVTSAWLCREAEFNGLDPRIIREQRLAELASRFPSHPELRYEHARATAWAGDIESARRIVQAGRRDLPAGRAWRRAETGLLFSRHDEIGQWLDSGELLLAFNGSLRSRPLSVEDLGQLNLSVSAQSDSGLSAVIQFRSPGCESEPVVVSGTRVIAMYAVPCAVAGEPLEVSFINDGLDDAGDINVHFAAHRQGSLTLPSSEGPSGR